MPLKPPQTLKMFDGKKESGGHATGHQQFILFPQLPEDLRLQIWKTSLQHERMIQICIYPNLRANSDSGESHAPQPRYRAAGRAHRVLSKLLSVNHEARDVAVAFYRVRIPCTLTRASPKQAIAAVSAVQQEHDTLPINPEYDVLQLSVSFSPDITIVQDFLRSLKALDPRGIGLRNLAIDVDDWPFHEQEAKKSSSTSTPSADTHASALRGLFSGLDEIYLTTTVSLGRVLVPARPRRDDSQREILFLNRAMPVCAHTPKFTRISRDRRPSVVVVEEEDLRRVFTADNGLGLDSQALAGRALLLQLGAQLGDMRAIRMSWLVAFRPAKEVHSHETAEEFVREEEARWAGTGPGPSFVDDWERLSGRYLCEVSDERKCVDADSDSLVKDLRGSGEVAFGYWSFYLDLNAPIDVKTEDKEADAWAFEHHWVTRPLHDFSKHLPEFISMDLA